MVITRVTYKDLPETGLTGVTGLTDGTFVGDGKIDILIEAEGTVNDIDTLGLGVDLDDLTFAQGKESILVTHPDLPDVVLSMRSIERVMGTDGSLAFDVEGNAGEMYALLATAFGKSDVTKELMGMALYLKDSGKTDMEVAQVILNSPAYKQDALGSSNETLVKQIYKNVLGTVPSFADLVYFTTELDKGTFTQAQLLEVASNLELTRDADHINLVGMSSISYTPYEG